MLLDLGKLRTAEKALNKYFENNTCEEIAFDLVNKCANTLAEMAVHYDDLTPGWYNDHIILFCLDPRFIYSLDKPMLQRYYIAKQVESDYVFSMIALCAKNRRKPA